MAYSTQNMYQMFDIIPNFVRKMFPLSLKTYPSCTNTMAWDIRDEIRSAYILRMVHQRVRTLLPSYLLYVLPLIFVYYWPLLCGRACLPRLLRYISGHTDNQKAKIDNASRERDNALLNTRDSDDCRSELVMNKTDLQNPSSRCEHTLYIKKINSRLTTPNSTTKLYEGQNNTEQKSIHQKSHRNPNAKLSDFTSSNFDNRSSGQTMQLLMTSTSFTAANGDSVPQNPQNPIATIEGKPTVQREYQLLAQKFHQYTINCRTTIRTLERKLKKLIDDKHALLHGMVSMRKGQKDGIKKYRKIFNDAMNEHCNEINALLANYKVIRDNYLELLQNDASSADKNPNDDIISVSYTSYDCC